MSALAYWSRWAAVRRGSGHEIPMIGSIVYIAPKTWMCFSAADLGDDIALMLKAYGTVCVRVRQ